jgi:hypothetical protein
LERNFAPMLLFINGTHKPGALLSMTLNKYMLISFPGFAEKKPKVKSGQGKFDARMNPSIIVIITYGNKPGLAFVIIFS